MSDHPKTDAVMPLVIALINRDVMPLIKRVILKRAELYLREIEKQQRASTPNSTSPADEEQREPPPNTTPTVAGNG